MVTQIEKKTQKKKHAHRENGQLLKFFPGSLRKDILIYFNRKTCKANRGSVSYFNFTFLYTNQCGKYSKILFLHNNLEYGLKNLIRITNL